MKISMQERNEKKADVRRFIEAYIQKHHTSPSTQEIAAAMEMNRSTVWRYLKEMNEDNEIHYRGEYVYTSVTEKISMEQVSIPLAGAIPCGTPDEQEENIEAYYSFPRAMFGKGEFFMLRAVGDSMVDAGIEPGDLIIIRKETTARNGQIVAALVDNSSTLKTYMKENEFGAAYLHPENKKAGYADIHEAFTIQGVAVKIIKDL